LLRNGVPLLRSLEISSESAGNRVLAQAIRDSAENVSAGSTLSGPLAACGLIPKPVMAMIHVAEQANNLDQVLVSIADGIDRRTTRQIDVVVRMAEPAMLLVMGVLIGFVLVALLLPVFDTMTMMG
jgi:general secretion pathway protein F/type IV pilus assembly protein PilC